MRHRLFTGAKVTKLKQLNVGELVLSAALILIDPDSVEKNFKCTFEKTKPMVRDGHSERAARCQKEKSIE